MFQKIAKKTNNTTRPFLFYMAKVQKEVIADAKAATQKEIKAAQSKAAGKRKI